MQEKLRVAILTKAAALTFIDGKGFPISNYKKKSERKKEFLLLTLVTNQNFFTYLQFTDSGHKSNFGNSWNWILLLAAFFHHV